MNYKLGVIALVALQAYTANAGRPCVCERSMDPVCGSDGVTYNNECLLECKKHTVNTDLTKTSDGPCSGSDQPSVCICTMNYKPVCGNDGVTYPNDCALRCKLDTNPQIRTAHEGTCEAEIPLCTCPDNLKEVCGTDGKTYANDCLLNCATANDNTLGIKHAGKCNTDNVEDNCPSKIPPCTCTKNFKPVCGSDGTTYSNDCLLNCATANDNTLRIKHAGKCETVKVVDINPTPPSCSCGRNVKPVCGSDGKTYNNDCLLNCATANDNTLSIKHAGKCETVNVVDINPTPPACLCGKNVKPVCGSDGKTYANDCLLNCATANDNTLSIKHGGKCETVKVVNFPIAPPCICTDNINEVCGTDGKTYTNDCELNCATAHDNTLGISHTGKCGHVNVVNNAPSGCTCSKDLQLVCGADGVTYNNLCLLECAGQSVRKEGEC